MTAFTSVAPVLPVRDVALAMDHYRKLGFDVTAYGDGTGYAYASRDTVTLHLAEVEGVDPAKSLTSVFLHVGDADELFSEWCDAGVGGRLVKPSATDYGLREGAHVDTDGNLLRFGSPTPAA